MDEDMNELRSRLQDLEAENARLREALTERTRWHDKLHPEARSKLRNPLLMGFVLLLVSLYDAGFHAMPPWAIVASLLAGFPLGYLVGYFVEVTWDEDQEQLLLERGPVLVTVIYVGLRIGAELLVHQELSGVLYALDVILLSAAGTTIGRALGSSRRLHAFHDATDDATAEPPAPPDA